MKRQHFLAFGLAIAMAGAPILAAGPGPSAGGAGSSAAGQQGALTVSISGVAKKEAKKPYTDYTTRARNVQNGEIAGTATNTDPEANFTISGLPPANYLVELLNKDGKIVCTEGPFNLTQTYVKNDVDISCNKIPAAWWLLGVASAAGVTSGVVVAPESAAQ